MRLQRFKNVFNLFFDQNLSFEQVRLLRNSGKFDRKYYLEANALLHWIHKMFPERHYLVFGERAGLQPNTEFSPKAYLKYNPDLIGKIDSPFVHYLLTGEKEGRVIYESSYTEHGPLPHVARRQKTAKQAIVVHIYYYELWPEISECLKKLDIEFDLFVTLTYTGNESEALIREIASRWPDAVVCPMPNHGRDIFPFVHLINSGVLEPYDAVCKIHTKQSPHRKDGDTWRQNLIEGILPKNGTQRLLDKFLKQQDAGIWVADGNHFDRAKWWGNNRQHSRELLDRLEMIIGPQGLSFPAGSMYWAKPLILQLIKGMLLEINDFETEDSQTDGTLAHAFERTIGLVCENAGYKIVETKTLRKKSAKADTQRADYISAFYLPQFHQIPENDVWWGTGYTEWTAVTQAKPMISNQLQPALPGELGFYDLRRPEVMAKQWALANENGIDAFCVYHYWFNGKRLLENPLDNLLDRPELPFTFYLCWANESWRRNWDGLSGEVLIAQDYNNGFEAKLAKDASRFFADPRYARPDGKRPRFVIYRLEDMPDPIASVEKLRQAWHELGVGDVELGAVKFHLPTSKKLPDELIDFWVEMPPHGLVNQEDYVFQPGKKSKLRGELDPNFGGHVYAYEAVRANSLKPEYLKSLPPNTIAGIMPSWDNTARRKYEAHIAYGANPGSFRCWLRDIQDRRLYGSYRRELMVNAWNEWAEKASIEPSRQFGQSYLHVLRDVIAKQGPKK